MAKIELKHLKHSYLPEPAGEDDYALKEINTVLEDGGAYALLGPSGCGKTTLLNIISGLLTPSEGQILFDDVDMTNTDTIDRHIAQVFQFPVVYDTMTVFDNLAFPLRNRGFKEAETLQRVTEVAKMLELEDVLNNRASGLSADGKQKISLGRGLVRKDVNVIMFDEPLTVIDPHLKWKLRSKLKELHQRVGSTMIYVTHDQTEALTFADQVVVMTEGRVVQIGTPIELFERPKHTFVGHFIGSPGMNVLPVTQQQGSILFAANRINIANDLGADMHNDRLEIGIRPEFIQFGSDNETGSIAVKINKINDLGRHRIVEVTHQQHSLKLISSEDEVIPSENPHIVFNPSKTHLYSDGWIVT